MADPFRSPAHFECMAGHQGFGDHHALFPLAEVLSDSPSPTLPHGWRILHAQWHVLHIEALAEHLE